MNNLAFPSCTGAAEVLGPSARIYIELISHYLDRLSLVVLQ